jgi:hypothetical protein
VVKALRACIPLALAALAALEGCLSAVKPDGAELSMASTAPRTTPNCANCHQYPLHDVNHNFHLHTLATHASVMTGFPDERSTGDIVCMDCHFGSIAHRDYDWFDTIWGRNGVPIPKEVAKLPTDSILFISPAIPGFLPIPEGASQQSTTPDLVNRKLDSAAALGTIVEWLTASKHLNGKVDVEFSPNFMVGQDTSLLSTAYNPKDMSCSSISCHSEPRKTYRWASKELGLTGCPTLRHTADLDSSCRYSPTQESE